MWSLPVTSELIRLMHAVVGYCPQCYLIFCSFQAVYNTLYTIYLQLNSQLHCLQIKQCISLFIIWSHCFCVYCLCMFAVFTFDICECFKRWFFFLHFCLSHSQHWVRIENNNKNKTGFKNVVYCWLRHYSTTSLHIRA